MTVIPTTLKLRHLDIPPPHPDSTSIVDLQGYMARGRSDPFIREVDHLCPVYPGGDVRA